MKIAVIDCGTNTFNLLVRSQEENKTLFNTKIPVRLAEGCSVGYPSLCNSFKEKT